MNKRALKMAISIPLVVIIFIAVWVGSIILLSTVLGDTLGFIVWTAVLFTIFGVFIYCAESK